MSNNFAKLFIGAYKRIFVNDISYQLNNPQQVKKSATFLMIFAFAHGMYALKTADSEKSVIVKKYKVVRNGFTDFMVMDEKGRHFNVNNSLWYWKWNSIEDWSNIKEGEELYFKYYGWRIPVFGLFPNIYMSNRAEFLDSMTTAQFISFENKQTN